MDIERAGYDRCEATYDTVCDKACDTEEEGVIVGYSKQKTVFDDRENDWKQFARQQAEFYANAEQYIYNLQEDLNELDEEIEQILQEIEGANYNVTQGYKVFKKLKELRNEKKEKATELECLYILTGGLSVGEWQRRWRFVWGK